MIRIDKIALLTDETPDLAVDFAESLAKRCGASVRLFSAMPPFRQVASTPEMLAIQVLPSAVSSATERAADLVSRADDLDVEASVSVARGPLESRFLDFLEQEDIDLAIMSHERVGWWTRLTNTDVTNAVLRESNTPVLALGTTEGIESTMDGFSRILVATTQSSDVYAAAAYARLLGTPTTEIVYIAEEGADFDVQQCVERAMFPAFATPEVIMSSEPLISSLKTHARRLNADAFFVGSQPDYDLVDRLFGTTADKLLGTAERLPVLVIPKMLRHHAKASQELDRVLAASMDAGDALPA